MHFIFNHLRQWLIDWGYWAVAFGLLLENAGIPVPGETILILASVLAYSHDELKLPWVIVVAIAAAATGDNIGYWIGREGGRPLLEKWKHLFRVSSDHILTGENLLKKHGAVAIFFARFVAGARIVAGPPAGVLRMHWRKFTLFNVLGAAAWVCTVSGIAYAFGSQVDRLLAFMSKLNTGILDRK